MSQNKLVSVIIPSYNHEDYIEKSISSVLEQTYRNIELIVIDDGSKDKSVDKILSLKQRKDFKFIAQNNQGLISVLNKGISISEGEYICFCSSDDCFLPEKIFKQMTFLEKHPEIPMCYSKSFTMDENNVIDYRVTDLRCSKLTGGYIFDDILLMNFHPPVNYMFRKSIFNELGLYPKNMWTEDYYYNLKISAKYPIGFIDEFLHCYREINAGEKLMNFKAMQSHKDCIDMYKDHPMYNLAMNRWYYRVFCYYASIRKYKGIALKAMVNSFLKNFYKRLYLISVLKLVFLWR